MKTFNLTAYQYTTAIYALHDAWDFILVDSWDLTNQPLSNALVDARLVRTFMNFKEHDAFIKLWFQDHSKH